jgi:hypothetical protein
MCVVVLLVLRTVQHGRQKLYSLLDLESMTEGYLSSCCVSVVMMRSHVWRSFFCLMQPQVCFSYSLDQKSSFSTMMHDIVLPDAVKNIQRK